MNASSSASRSSLFSSPSAATGLQRAAQERRPYHSLGCVRPAGAPLPCAGCYARPEIWQGVFGLQLAAAAAWKAQHCSPNSTPGHLRLGRPLRRCRSTPAGWKAPLCALRLQGCARAPQSAVCAAPIMGVYSAGP